MVQSVLSSFRRLKLGILVFIPCSILLSILVQAHSAPLNTPVADMNPKWTYTLPAKTCPNSSSKDCFTSSPVLVDITGDGRLDIIIGTNNGYVIAIRHDGVELWRRDLAPDFGMSPGSQEIFSSPAVDDVDHDGLPEIVIGAGTANNRNTTHGGVIVLEHDGTKKNGWPQFSAINHYGYHETVYGTPALGDLTGDGFLEVVVGGFDKKIYAWKHDGTLLPGFPPDSHLLNRFPSWTDLMGKLADTIWSSPALADIDRDGNLDIIIGTDEGNFDSSWGGDANGWACPYAPPAGGTQGYCGGALYVLNNQGQNLPGFPIYVLEAIVSTPAVQDIDGDGFPEIFVGTGTYYYRYSPDHPTNGFRLFAWDHNGNALSGWAGGKVVGSSTSASPSIGDITGDDTPEIIMGSKYDMMLHAWNINGSTVSGFPMKPIDRFGNGYPYAQNFILADYDGDSKMEIFVNQASMVTIVDGNGSQLTQYNGNGLPAYRTWGNNSNAPAVSDLDGDGKLELVAHNSTLYVWDLPNSSDVADWPMFKQNAARTSYIGEPILNITPPSFTRLHLNGDNSDVTFNLSVENTGINCFDWTATATQPANVSLSPTSGTVCKDEQTAVSVTIPTSGLSMGANDMGMINVTGQVSSENVKNSPQSIPLTIYLVDEIYNTYLPIIQK